MSLILLKQYSHISNKGLFYRDVDDFLPLILLCVYYVRRIVSKFASKLLTKNKSQQLYLQQALITITKQCL